MLQKWIADLKGKTGRSLDEWLVFIKKEGPKDEKARREWLKTKHKLCTNSAWWLAERADGKGTEEDDPEAYLKTALQYVDDQYSGKKAALRLIYDRLLEVGKAAGSEAKACPAKTIVPRCIAITSSHRSSPRRTRA